MLFASLASVRTATHHLAALEQAQRLGCARQRARLRAAATQPPLGGDKVLEPCGAEVERLPGEPARRPAGPVDGRETRRKSSESAPEAAVAGGKYW